MTRRQGLALWTVVLLGIGTGASARDSDPRPVAQAHGDVRSADLDSTLPAADGTGGRESGKVRYDSELVDGVLFQIGTAKDLQVRIALRRSRSLEATVLVVNASDRPVVFEPTEIRVEAEKKGKTIRLRTYSAEEWEEAQRADTAIEEEPLGAPAASAGQPPTATAAQDGIKSISYGDPCSGTLQGSNSPAGVKPTRQDCADAQSRPAAGGGARRGRPGARSETDVVNLARAQSVDPGRSYGGMVYIKKKKAEQYRVTVPVGDETFSFVFVIE